MTESNISHTSVGVTVLKLVLVLVPLHEGGVYGGEGLNALYGQAGSEGHGVLLGNAHIVGALGETTPELVDASTA